MEKGISVVISTYNGKARLAKTMECLVNQKFTCPYEIILVDNASKDGTKDFVDDWCRENSIKTIHYSSFDQPIPGKSYAQELGYNKAKHEYLLVCDDDNWLVETYIQDSFDIMESNIEIGALGGWCEAEFEGEKPDWFDTYAKYFAVSKQGTESGDITNKKGCLYGAGMVIRKSHWVQLKELGFKPLLTCRKGNTLSSGGDTEYSYVLRLLGYKMWYDERLYFKHFMTKERMSLEYVSRIRKAMSASNFVLRVYKNELKKNTVFKKDFFNAMIFEVKKRFLKQAKRRIYGSFEDKEISKEYFRNLKRLFLSYDEYYKNKEILNNWLPNNKNINSK